MTDLKKNPYYLSDEDCKWVQDTIDGGREGGTAFLSADSVP